MVRKVEIGRGTKLYILNLYNFMELLSRLYKSTVGKAYFARPIVMLIKPEKIRTWLYTSQFRDDASHAEILEARHKFDTKNESAGLTGFLITNGRAAMQLLEGPDEAVERFKTIISADVRHQNVVTEVWALEPKRAYPNWSIRYQDSSDYEALFRTIESAEMETVSISIARMLFDTTFDEG